MTETNHHTRSPLGLTAGNWVIIRSKEEILATLDSKGCLDGLPFQPEMLAFAGKRMRIFKSAHKTCDNIKKTGGRRMDRAYHLEGARCDGAQHGGCQADCVFFWKEAWLRADGSQAPSGPASAAGPCTESMVHDRALASKQDNPSDPVYVCQTTALFEATSPLAWWDIRQYIQDVTSGNHSAWHMFKILLAASYRKLVSFGIGYSLLVGFYNGFQKLRGGKPYAVGAGPIPDGKPTPKEELNLKVGELVQVKPVEEILPTLTKSGFNRGMRYDMEMAKYSGESYRVEKIVDKLISETTGKMVPMKTPCIQLANVYCRAECTPMRLGCPRASNSYWREIWLRRAETK